MFLFAVVTLLLSLNSICTFLFYCIFLYLFCRVVKEDHDDMRPFASKIMSFTNDTSSYHIYTYKQDTLDFSLIPPLRNLTHLHFKGNFRLFYPFFQIFCISGGYYPFFSYIFWLITNLYITIDINKSYNLLSISFCQIKLKNNFCHFILQLFSYPIF
jgi:hypothetical protein